MSSHVRELPRSDRATPSGGPQRNCTICTMRLEQLCYRRAWWFRAFREVLAGGVRLFAWAYGIRPDGFVTRAKCCRHCLRFSKNVLKARSPLFLRLDSWIHPVFNRLRDSLLTPEELAEARTFARLAEDSRFAGTFGDVTCLSAGDA